MEHAGDLKRNVREEEPLESTERIEGDQVDAAESFKFFGRLERGYLRLLRVSRVSPSSTGLRCHIETFALKDSADLEYLALSYTWGPAEEQEFMIPRQMSTQHEVDILLCNENDVEKSHKIGSNLHDFLQLVVNSPYVKRYYWIDALCINQTNEQEKDDQVKQMGEIYSSALRGVFWLGKAPSDSQIVPRLLDMINHLAGKFRTFGNSQNIRQGLAHITDPASPECLEALGLPEATTMNDWMNLVLFYQRKWFFRVWTVQEKALAKDPLFLLGMQPMPYLNITAVMYLIIHSPLGGQLIRLAQAKYIHRGDSCPERPSVLFPATHDHALMLMKGELSVQDQQNASEIWISSDASAEKKIASKLFNLLMGMRLLKASNPQDRVLGLLGILSKLSERYNHAPPELEFENRADVFEVFSKTMKYILTTTQSLSFLSGIQVRSSSKVDLSDAQRTKAREMDPLPSWVLDWTSPGPVPVVSRLAYDFPDYLAKISASLRFPGAPERFYFNDRVLHTHTINVARVICVGESYLEMLKFGLTRTINLLLEAIQLNPDGEDRVLALQNVMIFHRPDVKKSLADKYENWINGFRLFWKWIIALSIAKVWTQDFDPRVYRAKSPGLDRLTKIHGTGSFPSFEEVFIFFVDGLYSATGLRPDEPSNDARSAADTAYLEAALKEKMERRRPFLLDNGVVGLGPQDVQVGDTCRLLPCGALAPFIFRQAPAIDDKTREYSSKQILVGEAYVRELIFGPYQLSQKEWEAICIE